MVLEQLLEDFRAGKVSGLALTYETIDGESRHQLMGDYADDLMAATNQVRRLDVALNRHFLRSES